MIPVTPRYTNSIKKDFKNEFIEFSKFIKEWNDSKWQEQKDIRFTPKFKNFKNDLQNFFEPVMENFSGRCVYCGSDYNMSVRHAHPVEKNLEFPELCLDINNLIAICGKCAERINITYLKKHLVQKNRIKTKDLIKKIPNLIIPNFEPVHKYITINSTKNFTNRNVDFHTNFEDSVIDFLVNNAADRLMYTIDSLKLNYFEELIQNLISELSMLDIGQHLNPKDYRFNIYKELWLRSHREKENVRFLEADFEYADQIKLNKKLSYYYNSEMMELGGIGLIDYFKLESIEFENLRCFGYGKIDFKSDRGIFILGDNGVGKTTFLDIFSLFDSNGGNRDVLYRANDKFKLDKNKGVKLNLLCESYLRGNDEFEIVLKRNFESRNEFPSKQNLFPVCYIKTGRTGKSFVEDLNEMLFDNDYYTELTKVCSYILNLNEKEGFVRKNDRIYVNTDGQGEKEIFTISSGVTSIFRIVHSIFKVFGKQYKLDETPTGYKRGVVLIDELELHLHPKWKKLVALKLMEIFNDLFFVVTTHDPLILMGLNSEDVIVFNSDKKKMLTKINNELPEFDGYSLDILLTSPYFGLDNILHESSTKNLYSSNSYREYLSQRIVNESLELNLKYSPQELSMLVANKFNKEITSEED